MTVARIAGPHSSFSSPSFFFVPILFFLLILLSSSSLLPASSPEEYLYDVFMADIPAGTIREVWEETKIAGSCAIRVTSEMRITLPRGESELALGTKSIVEADCGTYRPRALRIERDEGGAIAITTAQRENDRLLVTTEKNGVTEKTTLTLGEDVVFFSMLFRKYPNDFFARKGSVAAISEEGMTMRTLSFEGYRINDTVEVKVLYEGVPVTFTLRGHVILSMTMNNGFITYRLRENKQTQPPSLKIPPRDILSLTAIPNEGIRVLRPRDARRMVVRVIGNTDGIPSFCWQSTTTTQRDGATVTVDSANVPCKEPPSLTDTAATLYEDRESPAVKKLAAQWQHITDRGVLLREVTHFVFRYITDKNYRHGTLSASETIATRSGDCTEHAVLATALLRALGVPARALYGLVLSDDGRFFFHHWIEAHTGVGWVPADPTFGATPADAARIVIARSSSGGAAEREEISLAVMRFLQRTRLAVMGISYE